MQATAEIQKIADGEISNPKKEAETSATVFLQSLRLVPSEQIEDQLPTDTTLPATETYITTEKQFPPEEYTFTDEHRFKTTKDELTRKNKREGGFNIVVKGEDEKLKRPVAIKLLKPAFVNLLDRQAILDYVAEVYGEITRIANLEHHHIAKIYDVVSTEVNGVRTVGMALEWLEPLEKQMSADEIIAMCTQIGSALDYAHQKGIVHKDIKPQNIMRRPQQDSNDNVTYEYVLTDLGSGRRLEVPEDHDHEFLTPRFVDREQTRKETKNNLMERMDQYALAISVCDSLLGKPYIMKRDPYLFCLPAEIPQAARAVLRKAMSEKREDRYTSCTEFAEALSAAIKTPDTQTSIPTVTVRDIQTHNTEPGFEIYDLVLHERILPERTARFRLAAKDPVEGNETLKAIQLDLVDALGFTKDAAIPPGTIAQMRKISQDVRILFKPQLSSPRVNPEHTAPPLIDRVEPIVIGAPHLSDRIRELVELADSAKKQSDILNRLKSLVSGSRKKQDPAQTLEDVAPPLEGKRVDWKELGTRLQVQKGMDKVEMLKKELAGTAMDLARKAYQEGNPKRAIELLQQFIVAHPELKLCIARRPDGLADRWVNDYNGSNSNHGVVRTESQLYDVIAGAINNGFPLVAQDVLGLVQQARETNSALLIIDEVQNLEAMYREMSHELNAWIISGYWSGNKKGDWRWHIPHHFDPESRREEGLNYKLDYFFTSYSDKDELHGNTPEPEQSADTVGQAQT